MRPEKLEYVYILNKDLTYMKKYGKSFKNLVLVRIFLDSYDFFSSQVCKNTSKYIFKAYS